jgi:hypothetical protein
MEQLVHKVLKDLQVKAQILKFNLQRQKILFQESFGEMIQLGYFIFIT